MKLTILGATGGTGTEIVKQALAGGHTVTALVRSPERLGDYRDQVKVVTGDVLDAGKVAEAVAGSDAVLSALGARSLGATTIYSESIKTIIGAMNEQGVHRLLCVGAVGMEPGRDPNISFVGRLAMKLILKHIIADMHTMQQILDASELEWTMMWAPMLTDSEVTGEYRTSNGASLKKGNKISRADLAHFMVHNIDNESIYRKKVAVAY